MAGATAPLKGFDPLDLANLGSEGEFRLGLKDGRREATIVYYIVHYN